MNFKLSEFVCRHCGSGIGLIHQELLARLQALRDLYGKPMSVNCGYRCPEHNKAVGGAPHSAHLTGMAADISDTDGELKRFCTEETLAKVDLYAEAYDSTPTWIHLQIRPTAARIFKP